MLARKFNTYTVNQLPDPSLVGFDVDGIYYVNAGNGKMTIAIRNEANSEWKMIYSESNCEGEKCITSFIDAKATIDKAGNYVIVGSWSLGILWDNDEGFLTIEGVCLQDYSLYIDDDGELVITNE